MIPIDDLIRMAHVFQQACIFFDSSCIYGWKVTKKIFQREEATRNRSIVIFHRWYHRLKLRTSK